MCRNGFEVMEEDVPELFRGDMSRYPLSNGSTKKLRVCVYVSREKRLRKNKRAQL